MRRDLFCLFSHDAHKRWSKPDYVGHIHRLALSVRKSSAMCWKHLSCLNPFELGTRLLAQRGGIRAARSGHPLQIFSRYNIGWAPPVRTTIGTS